MSRSARDSHRPRRTGHRRRHTARPPGAAGRSRGRRAVLDAVPDGRLPFGPVLHRGDIVFAFAWTPLLLAGSGSVLSLDAAINDWASQQAAAARRQARRSGAAAPEVHRREVLLRGMATAAVAAVSLVVAGLAAGLGRLAGVTAGAMQENATPCAVSTARAAIRSYSPPGRMASCGSEAVHRSQSRFLHAWWVTMAW